MRIPLKKMRSLPKNASFSRTVCDGFVIRSCFKTASLIHQLKESEWIDHRSKIEVSTFSSRAEFSCTKPFELPYSRRAHITAHHIPSYVCHSLAEILFESHVTINVFTSVLCKRNFSRAFKMRFFGLLLLNVYSDQCVG